MNTAPRLRLRFFFEVGSGVCLWAADAATEAALGDVVTPEQLPLPGNLHHTLRHLIAWFDTSIDWEHPTQPGPHWDAEEAQRFELARWRAGQALRQALPSEQFELLDGPGPHANTSVTA